MNKDSVLFSKQTRFSINYVVAYICEECKKVVLDYSDMRIEDSSRQYKMEHEIIEDNFIGSKSNE